MESRIMRVFYGIDCLPYKDSDRVVHYPIIGSGIVGENNVTTIRFYVDLIGGNTITWLAKVKKPDLTDYNALLDSTGSDEYGSYVELDLSALYTDQKGMVRIGLEGYEGANITVEDDEIVISGVPQIKATGEIQILMNYTPRTLPYEHFTPSEYQQLLGLVGAKLSKEFGIVQLEKLEDYASADLQANQTVFNKQDGKFYKYVGDGEFEVIETIAYKDYVDLELSKKQKKLIAGNHITIDEETGAISAESGITTFEGPYDSFEDLPTPSGLTYGAIYLVKIEDETQGNVLEEYITIFDEGVYSWELLGTTKVDLSNYPTKDEVFSSFVLMRQFPNVNINGFTLSHTTAVYAEALGLGAFTLLFDGRAFTENEVKSYVEKVTGQKFVPIYSEQKPQSVYIVFNAEQDYGTLIHSGDFVFTKLQWDGYNLKCFLVKSISLAGLESGKMDRIVITGQRRLTVEEYLKCLGGANVVGATINFGNPTVISLQNPFISLKHIAGGNYRGYIIGTTVSPNHILNFVEINLTDMDSSHTNPTEQIIRTVSLDEIIVGTDDRTNNNLTIGVAAQSSLGEKNYLFGTSYGQTSAKHDNVGIGRFTFGTGTHTATYCVAIGNNIVSLAGTGAVCIGDNSNNQWRDGTGSLKQDVNYQTILGYKAGGDATHGICIGAYSHNRIPYHVSFDGYLDNTAKSEVRRILDFYDLDSIGFRFEKVKPQAESTSSYANYKTLKQILDGVKDYVDEQIEGVTGVTHKYQHNVILRKVATGNKVYAMVSFSFISTYSTPLTTGTIYDYIPDSFIPANGFVGTSAGGATKHVLSIQNDEGSLWIQTNTETGYAGLESITPDEVSDYVEQIY